jgi:hypothetical protein
MKNQGSWRWKFAIVCSVIIIFVASISVSHATIIVTSDGTIASIGNYLSSVFAKGKEPIVSSTASITIMKGNPKSGTSTAPFPASENSKTTNGLAMVLGIASGNDPRGGVSNVSTPTIFLSANPTTINLGASTTLTWTSADASSCTASGDWLGLKSKSGAEVITPTAIGTKTYSLDCTGAGGSASSSVAVVVNTPALISQLLADQVSRGSHYSDNWYRLGTGYAGTLHTLTLQGYVNGAPFSASHVWLKEYKDALYSNLIQTFTISDDAPFTTDVATATFDNLSIPLKPYFYYRLDTVQGYQNRSVILLGTDTTGTAMYNEFVNGTGRVEHTYPFMPYMVGLGERNISATPPPLTAPSNISFDFNKLTLELTVSWTPSTDPDWSANPLYYEFNYSTSTTLDPNGWTTASNIIHVEVGNNYLVGVRARDNFGAVSDVATATWNFPVGFVPYVVSSPVGSMSQDFVLASAGTLRSTDVFIEGFSTTSVNPASNSCTLDLYDAESVPAVLIATSDTAYAGNHCTGQLTFDFTSTAPVLADGHRYRWIFSAVTGNISTHAAVTFYGTSVDTAGGFCTDGSPGGMCSSGAIANAKFALTGTAGTLFEN